MSSRVAALEVNNLTVSVPNRALIRSACFAVAAGECVGLTGPNGSGKSTLLRTVAGRLKHSVGHIAYGPRILSAVGGWRNGIGYMPADLDAPGFLTLDEYMRVIAVARGMSPTVWPDRVEELVEVLRLTAHRGRGLSELSTGTAKKVGFAAALLHRPPLLLCDEPFEGLDGDSVHAVTDLIREFVDTGGAALVCTHRTRYMVGLTHSALIVSEESIHVDESGFSTHPGANR